MSPNLKSNSLTNFGTELSPSRIGMNTRSSGFISPLSIGMLVFLILPLLRVTSAGQEYSADDTATMYNSTDTASTWYNDINPGNSVGGVIVFDIPKDQTPVSAELHDSAFSNGVKVNL